MTDQPKTTDGADQWRLWSDYQCRLKTNGTPFLCEDRVFGLRLAHFETGYGVRDLHSGQVLRQIIRAMDFKQ